MKKVLMPLAKGFEELEAVALINVIRRGGIEVLVASVGDVLNVSGAHNITLVADTRLEGIGADDIDMIVLPGGWGGTNILATDSKVQTLLKEMDAKGKLIGAICAAPYALHCAGVLKEHYTCYPSVEEKIRLEGYEGDRAQVVEEGNVMTSRGPGTAVCFGLAIVKKLSGEQKYAQVKASLLADEC